MLISDWNGCATLANQIPGEVSQDMTANQTQIKRKRGGQKGNRNARKHGFYPATSRLLPCPSPLRQEGKGAIWDLALEPHLSFGLGLSFGLWHLNFVCHLPPCISPWDCMASKNKWQLDETNRVYFNNRIGRLTYGKELLNFRKHSHFYKTNHLRLHRVSPPAPTNRKSRSQTDETNPVHLNN